MTVLGWFRRMQVPMARSLTVLFAAAWLGLAVQPCTAMEGHDEAGAATHHGGTASTGHDCPHCPPAPEPQEEAPCGTALSCDAIGAPMVTAKAQDLPPPGWFACLPATAAPQPGDHAVAEPMRPPVPPARRTTAASFQQRYCSYLK